MLRLLFHHSVSKRINERILNEDCYRPKHQIGKGPFVLSDGASESYDARVWSHLLVKSYRKRPCFSPEWVQQAVRRYATYRDVAGLSWSQQAAYERGSFATLLAVHVGENGPRADIVAVGDSIAVIGENGVLTASFPYSSPDQFAERPLLISTRADRNNWIAEVDPDRFRIAWQLSGSGVSLMAMTDALGAWLLTKPAERFPLLASIRSRALFTELVESERNSGRMRRDDTTLLVLGE
jgi:hypothetical protein